jgi:nitrogen fixation protein NifX
MRVAVATQDLTRVDAHFGWARHMMFFEVTPEGHHLLRTHRFRGTLRQDGDGAKLAPKLRAIRGCALVFVQDIGSDAVGKLAGLRVQAVRSYSGRPIAEALDDLSQRLRMRPPRWLRQQEQLSRRRAHSAR